MSIASKVTKARSIIAHGGVASLVKQTTDRYLVPLVYAPMCYLAVKKVQQKDLSVPELVNASFEMTHGYIAPMQVKGEITTLLEFLKQERPQTILEIGTARGGTLFLFANVLPNDALIISLDMPGGKFGGYPGWKKFLYTSFAKQGQDIRLIKANSHDLETVQKIRDILGGAKLDFLFIDAEHTYDGVKKDVELYRELVRPGGYVAFHDIAAYRPPSERYGDMKFIYDYWQEIKPHNEHTEIVEDWKQVNAKGDLWAGIGMLKIS